MIARPQDTQLYGMPVDSAAVRAVQIREDHIALVFLKLGVQSTNTLVIQLYVIHFFTPNGDRRLEIAKNGASFEAFKD